jgi:hypothetical protein
VTVQEQRKAEAPVIWALAGAAPRSGCSTAAFLLAGISALSGRETMLFRPGYWEAGPAQAQVSPEPLNPREMEILFSRLSAESRSAGKNLLRSVSQLQQKHSDAPLWVLDLGCSRSHVHWDIFWSADLSLIAAGHSKTAALRKMADSAWQRWLELALGIEDESLHVFLQQPGHERHNCKREDYFSSSKLRHLGPPRPIYQIIMKHNAGCVVDSRPDSGSWKCLFPAGQGQQTTDLAVLALDRSAIHLLQTMQAQLYLLPPEARAHLANRLKERINPEASKNAEDRVSEFLSSGLQTQIGSNQILNLDLNYFDMPAVVSQFGATDDEL